MSRYDDAGVGVAIAAILTWLVLALINVAFIAVIIWAIIKVVQHFIG